MRLSLSQIRSNLEQAVAAIEVTGKTHLEDTLSKIHVVLVELAKEVDSRMDRLYEDSEE